MASVHPALRTLSHRPWPLPAGLWAMAQTWHDLLFAHWPVEPSALRPLVPAELELDICQGRCWVGVIPFRMSGIRARGLPPLPGLSRFPELNVRSYVTFQGRPGVYFFSLDAANLTAVWAARTFYRLPYFHARMSSQAREEQIAYRCHRGDGRADFRAHFRPVGAITFRPRDSLERWLVERYCLYTVGCGRVFRADIHHPPWPLQDAEAEIEINTMASAAGISLPKTPPLLHFAQELEVLIWPLRLAR
jgi:uncharacterized protein YqjF (DUF2071 family)